MNMNFAKLGLLATSLIWLSGCGGSLKCSDGTFEKGDKCVGYDPDDETPPVTTLDPPGGRTRTNPLPDEIRLITDEPATVYYTIDGSEPGPDGPSEPSPVLIEDVVNGMTVRFYAVDAAGNAETPRTEVYDYDIAPPAQVGGLAIAFSGTNATLNWTNPADPDYTGSLLARITGPFDAQPVDGEFYTAGAVLSSSVQIVAAGTGTTFADPGRAPGFVRYAAWTHDDLGNYSLATPIWGDTPLGSFTATILVNVTAGTAAVTEQPDHLLLSATPSYDIVTGDLTVDLTVENEANRVFENPKMLVTSVSTGTFANADGMQEVLPFRSFGPESLAPAGIRTRNLVIDGVLPLDMVTIQVRFAESRTLIGSTRTRSTTVGLLLTDVGSGETLPAISLPPETNNGNHGGYRPGFLTPDRRFLYAGRTNGGPGVVQTIDLATRTVVGGVALLSTAPPAFGGGGNGDPNKGSLWGLSGNGNGHVFAVVKVAHRNRTGNAYLVRLSESFEETGRISLGSAQSLYAPRLSADGRWVVAPSEQGLFVVDAKTMVPLDFDAETPGAQPIETNDDARFAAFSAAGDRLYALPRSSNTFVIADLAGRTVSSRVFPDCCRMRGIEITADGRVWMAGQNVLATYDPQSDEVDSVGYPFGTVALTLGSGGQIHVVRNDRVTVDRLDENGVIVESFPLSNPLHGEWLQHTAR